MLSVFRNKSDKNGRIIKALDDIESELKTIGFWSANPPDFKVFYFTEAPSFQLWLQCVFLPSARDAVKKDDYPESSQVGLMALRQYEYHRHVKEAQNLISLLNKLDKIVEDY